MEHQLREIDDDSSQRRHCGSRGKVWPWIAACLSTTLAACTGFIVSPTSDDDSEPEETVDIALECQGAELAVGASPIRRLTREQFENSVKDVFQLAELPSAARSSLEQIPDGVTGGYTSTTQSATSVQVDLYVTAATSIATELGPSALTDRVSCDFAALECKREAIASLGRLLFRRPLGTDSEGDEVTRYIGLYEQIRATQPPAGAVNAVLTAMLSSPSFLYREEAVRMADKTAKVVPIDDLALASRLSFLFWQSGPDDELLTLAEAGTLHEPATLDDQVERLLADARSSRTIQSFHLQWLGILDLPSQDHGSEGWSPALGAAMLAETSRFVDHVVASGAGGFDELLTASYGFVDEQTAAIYGIPAPADPAQPTELPAERAGILTHPSVLTRYGEDPRETLRGKLIREQLFCAPKILLPDNIDTSADVDRLTTEPCVNCHARMDLIGLGFADFDGFGAYQPGSGGDGPAPEVVVEEELGLGDVAGPFSTPSELAQRLAKSAVVKSCFAEHWYRYASGRADDANDRCAAYRLGEAFNASGGDIRELLRTIATSEWFRVRSVEDFEAPAKEDE